MTDIDKLVYRYYHDPVLNDWSDLVCAIRLINREGK